MLTLSEYDQIALRLVSKWRRKCGPIELSDELLGRIVQYMAKADWKYSPEKAKKMSRTQYRRMNGIYAIREYVEKKRTKNKYHNVADFTKLAGRPVYSTFEPSGESNDAATKKVKFLLRNSQLSQRQKDIIDHILSGYDISQTAVLLEMKYEQCRELYVSAIKKMKRLSPCGQTLKISV